VRRAALNQLGKRGIQVKRVPPLLIQRPDVILRVTLERLVAHHLLVPDPGFYVVQIGAFDGRDHDPLHDLIVRYNWAGMLVEPQARPFQALCSTYADQPRLTLRNVAVGERDEVRPFYRIKEGPTIPNWVGKLASFDLATIMRHDNAQLRLEENLVCEQVRCVCFESLLADTDHVDLLQIDAEGYDATLIGLFDFERWQPSIVQFEHKHLSAWEYDTAILRLVEHGYQVAAAKVDTIAYKDTGAPVGAYS